MKICQTTRAHLALLSIKPTQSTQIHPFNVKLYFGFLLFVLSIILCCLFVIFEANSFLEYIQSFCMTTAVATVGLCFTAVVSQKSQLFKFIKSIEKIINISKFCTHFFLNRLKSAKFIIIKSLRIEKSSIENNPWGDWS